MTPIAFKRINLGNAYEQIKPLFESGMIGLGDMVFQFEKELADYVGANYVIAVNSCTSALFLCLLWEKMQGIRHVSIPSMTVPLVADAVLQAGLHLTLTDNTGWVGDRYQINGSNVIDSAHRLRRNDYQLFASDSKIKLCFSFYPTKTIGSADGGAIATNDEEFANWARKACVYGRNQQTMRQNSWDYDIEMQGYKMNWNNLQAAIALEQLRRLDETNKRRQEIVSRYNQLLGHNNTSEYLYRIDIIKRDQFLAFMLENGIECGVHFKPLHLMWPFADLLVTASRPYDFYLASGSPKKEVDYDYSLTASLPLYDLLTDEEVEYIAGKVREFIKKYE